MNVVRGRAGGLATYHKYGSAHMSNIGKRGANAFYLKYKWVPVFQSGWALIRRCDNLVVAFTGSVPGRMR